MIQIKQLIDDIPVPARGSLHAAGYDLRAAVDVTVAPQQEVLVPTGYAWHIPENHVGIIKDRSSLAWKHKMKTSAGVIDSDYRGDVGVVIKNMGMIPFVITKGDRIAQLIIVPFLAQPLEVVEDLESSERGANGYGSTGRK